MEAIKNQVVSNPLFGLALTVALYAFFTFLYRKTRAAILNPMLLTILMICGILLLFHIDFAQYNAGGSLITVLLGPATVVLAVPLYDQVGLIRKNAPVILISIAIGAILSMVSVFALCRIFGLGRTLTMSLIPKSVTSAIAMGVSETLGGVKAITVIAVLLSGILGAVAGPAFCRLIGIRSKVAIGLAMGTAAHGIATAKAVELGEEEAAMGSLAVSIAGLITVILAPVLVTLLIRIWS
ncbi:MAG: LrgB family protein [Oscillospiraceae bacterium]|nr:LrgB family protein [Oscillospiraceae bacterium]